MESAAQVSAAADCDAGSTEQAVAPSYSRGDLVWSKIYGFPWWPSEIRSVRGLKPRADEAPKVRVRFLHTADNAELPLDKILPYEANLELGVVKPKMFKSKGLEKKFVAAVQLGEEWKSRPPPAEPEHWSDDDVVDEEDVEDARAEASAHLDQWRRDGHELLGQHVARFFGPSKGPKAKAYLAVLTRWLPAEDRVLFHALHDDGDEEDLEEEDARRGIQLYRKQPEAKRRKHEQHVAREERRRKAEEKARQPRKPRSAFSLFGQEVRPQLSAASPSASAPEISKLVALRWRELDEASRAQYDAAAAADMRRYLKECQAAGIDSGSAGWAAGPLPPLSALEFFKDRCEVALGVRLADESALAPEVSALLKEGFSELPQDERDELDDLANADSERYEEELRTFQAAHARRRASLRERKAAEEAANAHVPMSKPRGTKRPKAGADVEEVH